MQRSKRSHYYKVDQAVKKYILNSLKGLAGDYLLLLIKKSINDINFSKVQLKMLVKRKLLFYYDPAFSFFLKTKSVTL